MRYILQIIWKKSKQLWVKPVLLVLQKLEVFSLEKRCFPAMMQSHVRFGRVFQTDIKSLPESTFGKHWGLAKMRVSPGVLNKIYGSNIKKDPNLVWFHRSVGLNWREWGNFLIAQPDIDSHGLEHVKLPFNSKGLKVRCKKSFLEFVKKFLVNSGNLALSVKTLVFQNQQKIPWKFMEDADKKKY